MKEEVATAWAPSHATLVFAVPEGVPGGLEPQDYEKILNYGSLGIGINFKEGVTTEVKVGEEDVIYYNNEKIEGVISRTVLEIFRQRTGIENKVIIHHTSKVPTGCGLSTSGAGSIGLAIALNSLFGTELDQRETLQIAHVAEVICKTGLGSVIGQSVVGIEIRSEIGAPGVGKVQSIPSEDEVLIIVLGPLSTSSVLSSKDQMKKVTETGIATLEGVSGNESIDEIILKGREFMFECGLLTPRVRRIVEELEDMGEKVSTMAMIGETLIIKPRDIKKLKKWAEENEYYFISTSVSNELPHLVLN